MGDRKSPIAFYGSDKWKSKFQTLPNPKQIQNPKSKFRVLDFEIGIYLAALAVCGFGIFIGERVQNIPHHVAIIMDGNGRWAKTRGLPKIAGHRAGAKSVREAIEAAEELDVKVLTLYTFSTENWKRPKPEIGALFRMLGEYLDKEEAKLKKNNIKFLTTGDMDGLPDAVRSRVKRVTESTSANSGLTLNLALNYGSRPEILRAARNIAKDAKSGRLDPEKIDERLFSGYLYTCSLPDPDLLIRTSGEYRLSNFLLWQAAYSELYITKKLWPDFRKGDFRKAVAEYQKRERRFGG